MMQIISGVYFVMYNQVTPCCSFTNFNFPNSKNIFFFFLRSVRRNWLSLSICLSFCRDNFLVRYSVMFIILNQLSDWLNDWPELYAVSAIFEPCNVEPAVRRENHEIVMIIAHTFCVGICVQLSYEETIDVETYSIQIFFWLWFIINK